MTRLLALARACHPEPTVAVTLVAGVLAAAVGRGPGGTAAVLAAVLAGQLSVGWSNDWADADRDTAAGRRDKPAATGAVPRRTVRTAALLAAAATVPLSFLSGPVAGPVHLLAVGSAWLYNRPLKATAFSVLPYLVSFGLLPAFVLLGLPGSPAPPGWLVAAGAALGAGAHFANVLPDLADDRATGVFGLPHRLGATGSAAAAAGLLLAASVVLAFGPPGPPGPPLLAGLAVTVVALPCGGLVAARRGTRWVFRTVLLVAVVDVSLLVAAGATLREG